MFDKEEELVEIGSHSYNLKPGGEGGWDYINSHPDQFLTEKRLAALWSAEKARKILKIKLETDKEFRDSFIHRSQEQLKRIREIYPQGTFYGRSHSEETRKKMSEKASLRSKGSGNTQYGTMWITNGTANRKIKKEDVIPEGWRRGRVIIAGCDGHRLVS